MYKRRETTVQGETIMTPTSAALSSIIKGKVDFCCLCLITIKEESIRLTDEAVFVIDDEDCNTTVKEVLKFVFDEGMHEYLSTFNSICSQCIKLAISYYKFIQTSQKNAEYFTNILDGITNSLLYTTNEFGDSKSLFVSLNTHDFISKHYYDLRNTPTTKKSALKRYYKLDNAKNLAAKNPLFNIDDEKITEEIVNKKPRAVIDIATSDMLFDKNNRNLIKCKECSKEYLNICNLRNHYIRVHAPKTFKCSQCPKSYGSAAFLACHRSESHCTYVCVECGKTFHNKNSLKLHEMGHNLSLICQDCGRIYKNNTTFRKHKEQNVCGQKTRADPAKAKFTCDHCNKKYTQKMSLRVHIQYEHGNYKAHVCEWCGKKFWAHSRLKAHMVKHTKEKNYPCTICGGRFVSKESLLYHTRTHTGEKPYKCHHCEARFLSASRRSQHVKSHHLGGTLSCDICHSKFKSKTFLQKHKKTHLKHDDNTNTNYSTVKNNTTKSLYTDQSRSILTKIDLNPEIMSRDIWKIDELDDVEIQSFQNVIESEEVQIQNFSQVYEEHNISDDGKVYVEVPGDADDFMELVS